MSEYLWMRAEKKRFNRITSIVGIHISSFNRHIVCVIAHKRWIVASNIFFLLSFVFFIVVVIVVVVVVVIVVVFFFFFYYSFFSSFSVDESLSPCRGFYALIFTLPNVHMHVLPMYKDVCAGINWVYAWLVVFSISLHVFSYFSLSCAFFYSSSVHCGKCFFLLPYSATKFRWEKWLNCYHSISQATLNERCNIISKHIFLEKKIGEIMQTTNVI